MADFAATVMDINSAFVHAKPLFRCRTFNVYSDGKANQEIIHEVRNILSPVLQRASALISWWHRCLIWKPPRSVSLSSDGSRPRRRRWTACPVYLSNSGQDCMRPSKVRSSPFRSATGCHARTNTAATWARSSPQSTLHAQKPARGAETHFPGRTPYPAFSSNKRKLGHTRNAGTGRRRLGQAFRTPDPLHSRLP